MPVVIKRSLLASKSVRKLLLAEYGEEGGCGGTSYVRKIEHEKSDLQELSNSKDGEML